MTERHPTVNDTARDSLEARRKGRRLLWLGGAGIAVMAAAAVYVNLGPSRPLRVSKETTYITEPLKSDGKQVDYFAALQEATYPANIATDENGYRLIAKHLGKGFEGTPVHFAAVCKELGLDAHTIRPDVTYMDPSHFITVYSKSEEFDESLLEQFRPEERSSLNLVHMLDNRLTRPWTLDDLPMMAAWLEENGSALDLMAQAVRKPTFHIPMARQSEDELLMGLLIPGLWNTRLFSRGLVARSNYRIATGDIDGALDDLVTCKRLGRHLAQGATLVDLVVGIRTERDARAVGIAGSLDHPPTKEQLERLLDEMDKLPSAALMQQRSRLERFFVLDGIQAISHGRESLGDSGLVGWNPPPIVSKLARLRIDWNVVARRFNEVVDETLATGELPAREELTPADVVPLISVRARSEFLGDVLAFRFWPGWSNATEDTRHIQCAGHMQRIALAMLLYERDHGTLPPAWSADGAGNPRHSWRVLLLPYLGYGELYERIRLDEPWDSPHNRQFHGEAVSFYRCPGNPAAKPGETTYSVVVGPDMPFEAGEGKRLGDFGPLSDDMILLVERTDPVGWMDPAREVTQADAELGIHPQRPVLPPGRLGLWHARSNFALRNGAVRALPYHIDTALLKDLLRGTNAEKRLDF